MRDRSLQSVINQIIDNVDHLIPAYSEALPGIQPLMHAGVRDVFGFFPEGCMGLHRTGVKADNRGCRSALQHVRQYVPFIAYY